MSNIDDAADQVLALAPKLQSLIDLAEVVKSIGSLDQAVVERKAVLEGVVSELGATKAALNGARIALEEIRGSWDEEQARHIEACSGIQERATTEANDILAQARMSADALLTEAKANAAAVLQSQESDIAARRDVLAELQNKINGANDTLTAIAASHADFSSRIEALKDAAKSLLLN